MTYFANRDGAKVDVVQYDFNANGMADAVRETGKKGVVLQALDTNNDGMIDTARCEDGTNSGSSPNRMN